MNENSTAFKQQQKLASARLTAKQAQCLALHCYDGLSEEEIGLRLGIRHQTVSRRIVAARRRLDKVGLRAEPVHIEFQAVLCPMDPAELDKLGPREIKAVW